MAHKLSGAPCCTPSARVLSPRHSSPSRSHRDGQHDSGSVYKPPRRCKLMTTAAAGEGPPSVGRSTGCRQHLHSQHLHAQTLPLLLVMSLAVF